MSIKVIPVIHYESDEQVFRNAELAFDAGVAGVLLIHMKRKNRGLAPVARSIKGRWPEKLVGINYLGMDPAEAVRRNIADGLDMTWTDNQLTHTEETSWERAVSVQRAAAGMPEHLVFAAVAFKHQRPEPCPDLAALAAAKFGFIPTTSGPATGVAADAGKIAQLRAAMGNAPLAIASGITPENVHEFAPSVSHILVASGVSSSFYEFDFEKLYQLRARADQSGDQP